MAKSKSFFGLRTGSTKSLTFQVYRGQQITKDRVTRISNPRSEAQMKQRALIPIVAASRAALKGLVDHSFEGVAYGEQSLKTFSAINLRAGALVVRSYSPNGYSNPGFADLIVSKGSLGSYPNTYSAGWIISEDDTEVVFWFNTEGINDLKFKAAQTGDSAVAILQTVADWGATDCQEVAPGNQLTFLTVSNTDEVVVGNNRAPMSSFDICRLLFPSTETTPSQISDVDGSFKVQSDVTEGASSVNMYNNNVVVHIGYNKERHVLTIAVQPTNNPSGSNVVGAALIRSAYINGTWKRSHSTIHFPKDLDPMYTYEMWRSFYESTGKSAKYLNQGDENTGIA